MTFKQAIEFLKQSENHSIWRSDLPGMITMRKGELVFYDLEMKAHLLMFSAVSVMDKLATDWQIAVTAD